MVQGDGEVGSKQALVEALRLADSTSSRPVRSVLEAGADPTDIAQRYADVAQALYRERKNVTQMLAVAKAGITYCLSAAAEDPAAAATLKTKRHRLQRCRQQLAGLGRRRDCHRAIAHRGGVRPGSAFP